jgi:hypothetical protein
MRLHGKHAGACMPQGGSSALSQLLHPVSCNLTPAHLPRAAVGPPCLCAALDQ